MRRFIGFLLSCWVSLAAASVDDSLPLRLPVGVAPTAYKLDLTVDPNLPTHSGEVAISVDITQTCKVIR